MKVSYDGPFTSIKEVGRYVDQTGPFIDIDPKIGLALMEGLENPRDWTVDDKGNFVKFKDAVFNIKKGSLRGDLGEIEIVYSPNSKIIEVQFNKKVDISFGMSGDLEISVFNEESDEPIDSFAFPLENIKDQSYRLNLKEPLKDNKFLVSSFDYISIKFTEIDVIDFYLKKSDDLRELKNEVGEILEIPLPKNNQGIVPYTRSSSPISKSGVIAQWIKKGRKLAFKLNKAGGVKYYPRGQFIIIVTERDNPDAILITRTLSEDEIDGLVIENVAKKSDDIDIYSNLVYRDLYFITR